MCRIRKQQLIDEGINPESNIDQELFTFFEKKMSDGSLVEWLLEENEKIVATAAILFMEFPPTFTNPSGVKGYITNMFTHPDYRGKGIASAMLGKLTDEARKRGVKHIWLLSSNPGKPVYGHFGFIQTDKYMELNLDP